jgi:type IV pilus assembly protein PilO
MFGLENRPVWMSAVAGAVTGLLVSALLYQVITRKKQDPEIAGLNARLAEQQAKIQEGRAAEQKLPQFREEVARLQVELDKLLRILPARRNTPDLLRRIRALAEQGDFDLKLFTPGNFIDKDFYSEWPISIAVDGTYHNLASFFDRVGRFSRIINVENLDVIQNRSNKRGHSISSTFVAKTFVYKDAPIDPAAAGGTP